MVVPGFNCPQFVSSELMPAGVNLLNVGCPHLVLVTFGDLLLDQDDHDVQRAGRSEVLKANHSCNNRASTLYQQPHGSPQEWGRRELKPI